MDEMSMAVEAAGMARSEVEAQLSKVTLSKEPPNHCVISLAVTVAQHCGKAGQTKTQGYHALCKQCFSLHEALNGFFSFPYSNENDYIQTGVANWSIV